MIGIFRLTLQPKKSRCQIFKFKTMQKKSFFIGTMTMLLVLIFVSCSNEQPTSVEKKRNLPAQQRSIIPTNALISLFWRKQEQHNMVSFMYRLI